MSMIGAGELCRAILEDAEVARAFDLDADGERDLLSAYMLATQNSSMASTQLRVITMHGLSASQTLSTLGVGGANVIA